MSTSTSATSSGRPRDAAIDAAVLDATLAELAREGYAGLSISAVAQAAGTTRPAIYRRWADKPSLVIDAIAQLAAVDPPATSEDPFEDLVAELAHFRHCITDAGALPLAGLMLGESLDAEVRARYQELVVAPRRARLRSVLARAREAGVFSPDADVEVAGTFLTGSWYAIALAQAAPPREWARRVARLVWRACGAEPPA